MSETYIAVAAGGAFQNIVASGLSPVPFKYAVDNHFAGPEFLGIPVKRPSALSEEARDATKLVIFAMSSAVFRVLRAEMQRLGFAPENILYYGDVFFDGLRARLEPFGIPLQRAHHEFAHAASMIFPVDNHSSSLGTAMLLGMMAAAPSRTGAVVELGAYKGGNALLTNLASTLDGAARPYYVVDSFEGFPELSPKDPAASAGMFRDTAYEDIAAMFAPFPRARVVRGFVPAVLPALPETHYSVVYYDCDLYQPAVDSLEFFFPRVETGGFLFIHDYLPKVGGFDGVRTAVDEFLGRLGPDRVDRVEVPETTHLILRKR